MYLVSIDDYTRDGRPGELDFYVVFTMIFSGVNFAAVERTQIPAYLEPKDTRFIVVVAYPQYKSDVIGPQIVANPETFQAETNDCDAV